MSYMADSRIVSYFGFSIIFYWMIIKYNEHLSGAQISLEGLMAQNELDKNT